jgi:hypothetical protein
VNGRNPDEVITFDGAQWGRSSIGRGIITRGVLLDVPKYRESLVTMDKPIHGWD